LTKARLVFTYNRKRFRKFI